MAAYLLHRLRQLVKALPQYRQGGLSSLGEPKRPGQAPEKGHLKQFFQSLDLMADRCRRHIQLGRRLCKTEMPAGRLEGPESVQGRVRSIHSLHLNFSNT